MSEISRERGKAVESQGKGWEDEYADGNGGFGIKKKRAPWREGERGLPYSLST